MSKLGEAEAESNRLQPTIWQDSAKSTQGRYLCRSVVDSLPSWMVAAPDEDHCLQLWILPGVDRAWCVFIIHLESYQCISLRLATLVNTENVCVEVLNL